MSRPVDIDKKQAFRDMWLSRNTYSLDTRFVLWDGKKHPAAILVPGGGYGMVCSFIEGVPIARKLNEKGISCFIVYYRVREKARFPAPQDDLARAVREVLSKAEHYFIEPENYSVWGASAGGHLAASFGTDHMGYAKYGLPKPGALVLTYPVITMEPALTHRGTHDNLLGRAAAKEREEYTSVERHVTAAYPRTFIWCGDADGAVPPENTKRMAAALETAGVPYQCEIYPGVDHGVGPGTGTAAQGWIDKAAAFWLGE